VSAYIESRSPQNPADLVVRVADAGRDDVARAVVGARTAAVRWAREPALTRSGALTACANALEKSRHDLADLVVREVGKPISEAVAEVTRGVAILRYHAQVALLPQGDVLPSPDSRSLLYTRRLPRGVAGLITPWNFPVAIPLWKAAPALAAGNTVVLKPSEKSPAVALRLAELFGSELPTDILQVVPGTAEAGAALVDLTDVVSFTGSIRAGTSVRDRAVARGVPVQCEMGGQNASVVLPDADVEGAARTIAGAAMGYAGQKCTATSRVVVVGDADGFAARLAEEVAALRVGDPGEMATVVGPVIDVDSRDYVLGSIRRAEASGARVLTGGAAPDGDGAFALPTVVDRVPPGGELVTEEVFGPVCTVIATANVAEALAVANEVRHGLVTALYTEDLSAALDLVPQFDTGMVKVNAPTTGVDLYAPFGGEKESSFGPREQGTVARDFYTRSITVTLSPSR
jgi:alpha-ketoglutaric semialdehyde dehydrogenase